MGNLNLVMPKGVCLSDSCTPDCRVGMKSFDLQFDLHLFLQAPTVIVQNKSRNLFQPIKVAACENK